MLRTKWCNHPSSCYQHVLSGCIRALGIALTIKLILQLIQHTIPTLRLLQLKTPLPPSEPPSSSSSSSSSSSTLARSRSIISQLTSPTFYARFAVEMIKRMARKREREDMARFVMFYVSWVVVYKSSLCILRRIMSHQSHQRLNYMIAGSISGLTLFIDNNGARMMEISFYFLSRCFSLLFSYLYQSSLAVLRSNTTTTTIPSITTPRNHHHHLHTTLPVSGGGGGVRKMISGLVKRGGEVIPVLIFCVFAGITQYSYVYEPGLMRKPYFQFIDEMAKDRQGRLDKFILYIRSLYHTHIPADYELMERSLSHTDYYYTGQYFAPDPHHYITDDIKPYMNIKPSPSPSPSSHPPHHGDDDELNVEDELCDDEEIDE